MAKSKKDQAIDDGLLKYQERLVVLEDNNLQTRLIKEAYTQISIAYLGKTKTYKIIGNQYYQPRMIADIDQYVRNCNDCCRSTILQDKMPRLLKPLLIPNRPQQYILIDFYKLLKDCNSYNIVQILIDCFGKQAFLIPYKKTIIAKKAT